jgi:hypothetical protein
MTEVAVLVSSLEMEYAHLFHQSVLISPEKRGNLFVIIQEHVQFMRAWHQYLQIEILKMKAHCLRRLFNVKRDRKARKLLIFY